MSDTPVFGWMGKILRIDLSQRRIESQDSAPLIPHYLGGRGFGARIAWDELAPGIGAFDPRNPLMALTGPLCGTSAPCSGRTQIMGVSPQAYPIEWFTRSNMGGHFGPALKYAGYDGVVVTGHAEKPCYVWINDDKVEIRDGAELWGLGTYATQTRLQELHGKDARILTIGPAGENLSRIAIVNSETESAAGAGGFGAVMGSKNLKAIVVRGSGGVRIAHPKLLLERSLAIAGVAHHPLGWPEPLSLDPEKVRAYGERFHACTQQCPSRCTESRFYENVPGTVFKDRTYRGQLHCAAALFQGFKTTFYDWGLGWEAGFEISNLVNDYGLNNWEILFAIVPWLRDCHRAGLLPDLDGMPVDFDDPHLWAELLRKIAYREGIGAALAEGGRRAPDILGFGKELADPYYTAWGFACHWDGHGNRVNQIYYPYWLVTALQWMVDTRDPMADGHDYCEHLMRWNKDFAPHAGLEWEDFMNVAETLYGSANAVDPRSDYEDKAYPAVWHGHRSIIKDSMPVDDALFPMIYSMDTPDHRARAGGMEGTSFEYYLFTAATGVDMTEDEFNLSAERVFNLERALQIRNYGRDRRMDETVIPYFSTIEWWENPVTHERRALDPTRFRALMDEYYRLRGWDERSGRPTTAQLLRLGLPDVASALSA